MGKTKIYVIFALIFMTTAVFAQKPDFGRDRFNSRDNQSTTRELELESLDLTDEQKFKLQVIKADQKRKIVRIKADISVIEITKKQTVKNREFNAEVVKVQIKQIMDLKTNVEMVKFDSLDRTRKILTDEQWKAYCEISKKHRYPRNRNRNNNRRRPPRDYSEQEMEY
ncbi:MAG: hypothetical protein GY760_04415 [Deltaproteobacteria bacterium]|nr:hypothetical protein [Deltaproteobacteria bacterium]